MTILGDKDILQRKKIGFIASRKISTLSVLPTYDWAVEVSKRKDVAVMSGFHSPMERDVLKILLQGECGIIIVLARGMYRKLPKQYEKAMEQNRLLIISNEKESVTRVSELSAHNRNKYVEELSDEMKRIG